MLRRSLPLLALLIVPCLSNAQEPAKLPWPDRFAIVFNLGYAGDHLPADPAEFEKMIVGIKKANYNVVLCKYNPERLKICAKHDVQMFVDLLVGEHHVFKNEAEAKKLCESLKDSKAVYGYHLWSDNIGKTSPGRSRDAQNVFKWDPNHPAYVGSYRMSGVSKITGEAMFGYYDFHWTRGGRAAQFGHLNQAWGVAKAHQIPFLRYEAAAPGGVGKGNANRVGFTFATSIPYGLRGYMYHYAGGQYVKGSYEPDALGKDLAEVNKRFADVGPELMKIGISTAIYATPASKLEKNDPVPDGPKVPDGFTPVPAGNWFQIKTGEVIVGVAPDKQKREVLIFACQNPYESQKVSLAFPKGVKTAEVFDRAARGWKPAPKNAVDFTVEDYGVSLVRVTR